jgi:FlaG/FlaF family flagellin (archaellin)
MKEKNTNSPAISETVSVILVIALVLVLAIVVYALLFGSVDQKYLKKSVYVAGSAQMTSIPTVPGADPYYLLTFMPKAGDQFYLTGQTTTSGTQTTMKIISPDGRNLTPDASALKGSLYGKNLYIYPLSTSNECQYSVTDVPPPNPAQLPKMVTGSYQIMLIDENVHVLADTYTTVITQGTTSLPRTVLTGTVTGTSYRADCSQTGGTCPNGCPSVSNISPCNTTYSTYNGNNYLSFPNDPSLQYTGDMTIAVSIQPTSAGSPSDTSTWHQIIGKGVIYPNSTEVDNYQLFQLGNQLYFEWNDAVTGIHYHAETPTGIVQAGQWDQINVVVQNGNLAIYNNGVSQPLTYYQSNIPSANQAQTPIAAPQVHLENTPNPVTVGKQNGNDPSNNFNFDGNIGAVSLYDRALSPGEITSDLCA